MSSPAMNASDPAAARAKTAAFDAVLGYMDHLASQ